MKTKIILLITIIALNIADVATTLYALPLGVTELNPFFSVKQIPAKIVASLVYAGFFLLTYNRCMKIGFSKGLHILNFTLYGLLGIYTVVVTNNLIQIILWGI